MRIAFYAPLKAPDHPVPSGDRQMARLLVAALEAGRHAVEVASTLRSFAASPDAVRQEEAERAADFEVRRLVQRWSAAGAAPPDLWFTYHPFYKAPDLLGPRLADRFSVPYATAEASHAPKRAAGPWASWHAATEAALRTAAVHFCFTDQDREGLERIVGLRGALVALPPFIAAVPLPGGRPRGRGAGEPARFIAVAMMRGGDKLRSYRLLAEALRRLPADVPWQLRIVGDGPARADVEAAFATLGGARVSFLGEVAPETVPALLAEADLYTWPGFNEAYGVSYLEAAAAGLPALAMRCGGISSVVVDGRTGLLVPEGDVDAYAGALADLLGDPERRRALGLAARSFVTTERTVARAAAILDAALSRIVAGS